MAGLTRNEDGIANEQQSPWRYIKDLLTSKEVHAEYCKLAVHALANAAVFVLFYLARSPNAVVFAWILANALLLAWLLRAKKRFWVKAIVTLNLTLVLLGGTGLIIHKAHRHRKFLAELRNADVVFVPLIATQDYHDFLKEFERSSVSSPQLECSLNHITITEPFEFDVDLNAMHLVELEKFGSEEVTITFTPSFQMVKNPLQIGMDDKSALSFSNANKLTIKSDSPNDLGRLTKRLCIALAHLESKNHCDASDAFDELSVSIDQSAGIDMAPHPSALSMMCAMIDGDFDRVERLTLERKSEWESATNFLSQRALLQALVMEKRFDKASMLIQNNVKTYPGLSLLFVFDEIEAIYRIQPFGVEDAEIIIDIAEKHLDNEQLSDSAKARLLEFRGMMRIRYAQKNSKGFNERINNGLVDIEDAYNLIGENCNEARMQCYWDAGTRKRDGQYLAKALSLSKPATSPGDCGPIDWINLAFMANEIKDHELAVFAFNEALSGKNRSIENLPTLYLKAGAEGYQVLGDWSTSAKYWFQIAESSEKVDLSIEKDAYAAAYLGRNAKLTKHLKSIELTPSANDLVKHSWGFLAFQNENNGEHELVRFIANAAKFDGREKDICKKFHDSPKSFKTLTDAIKTDPSNIEVVKIVANAAWKQLRGNQDSIANLRLFLECIDVFVEDCLSRSSSKFECKLRLLQELQSIRISVFDGKWNHDAEPWWWMYAKRHTKTLEKMESDLTSRLEWANVRKQILQSQE